MRKVKRVGTSLALALLVGAVGAEAANAGQGLPASCMGIERAAINPAGTSEEEPGGSRQFNAEVKEIAESLGVPPGALVGFVAHLHEGTHEACDAALAGG